MGSSVEQATQKNKQALAIALMGPTASGKTELSLRLAEHLKGEIISVDSALVYRGLNIGAAKPSAAEQARAPHHLIDIRDPDEPYSAAEFSRDARNIINDIVSRGKVPILAGGTMLYFKALLEGISKIPPANQEVREQIEAQASQIGWPAIHEQLRQVDPIAAEKIHPNHSQRVSRALEVYLSSGKPMSKWQVGFEGGLLNDFQWVQIALSPRDRLLLHKRIGMRFDAMIEQGFLDEMKSLRSNPKLHKDLPAIRAVGYRQAWEYLDGDYDFDEMRDKANAATRQLAKRQLTWLRAWPGLNWVDTQNKEGKYRSIEEILQESLGFCSKSTI